MSNLSRRLIMLKPMRAGVSGYARLQTERGRTLVQLHLRGLKAAGVRAFWYLSGGEAVLLGAASVNPRGEASLTAELPEGRAAPERMQALLALSDGDSVEALMIGLCVQQSAESLLDAKNAALALCERLRGEERRRKEREEAAGDGAAALASEEQGQAAAQFVSAPITADGNGASCAVSVEPAAAPCEQLEVQSHTPQSRASQPLKPQSQTQEQAQAAPTTADNSGATGAPSAAPADGIPRGQPLSQSGAPQADERLQVQPQEQSISAPITADNSGATGAPSADPAPSIPDASPRDARLPAVNPRPHLSGPPADRLRPLQWPKGFEQISAFFRDTPRLALFRLPGWRFVYAAQGGGPEGLWLGYWQADGRVRQVAYAVRGDRPPAEGYRAARGIDGSVYQVLWQRV